MNKEKIIEVTKLVGGTIISIGTGAIVKNIVNYTTPSNTKKLTSVCIGLVALLIVDAVTDKLTDTLVENIETFSDAVDEIKEELHQCSEKEEIEKGNQYAKEIHFWSYGL